MWSVAVMTWKLKMNAFSHPIPIVDLLLFPDLPARSRNMKQTVRYRLIS